MNIKLLLFVIAAIEIVFLEEVTNKNKIEIDIIPQSELLVERQHEVNFMRKTWKIVICLDSSWLKYDLTAVELIFNNNLLIIESSLSRLRPLQKAGREKLGKLQEGSNKKVKFDSNDNFSSLLESATGIITKELTNFITIGFQIIEATREIQNQHITSSLNVHEDIDKLIQEIETTEPFYIFPIDIKLGSLRYLDKLCKIRYGAWMSRFFLFN